MIFETKGQYTCQLQPLKVGNIDDKVLERLLRDGRKSAFLVYEHLLATHENFQRIKGSQYPENCVALLDGQVLLIRMLTACGIALNPHKQNGCGRQFDKWELRGLRLKLSGYIFADIKDLPRLDYAFVALEKIPESTRHLTYDEGRTCMFSVDNPKFSWVGV